MRMMPEAWAFQRGQVQLVVPTWGNMAPDLAGVVISCTPIEGQRGRILPLSHYCFQCLSTHTWGKLLCENGPAHP